MRATVKATLRATLWICLATLIFAGAGCIKRQESEVVVYAALDQEFSEPILDEFSKQSGIAVRAKFDTESTKTVGLAEAIIAERDRVRCDVFWNNELLHTIRLERAGLLEPYRSPFADDYPLMYRSPRGMWYGFAARARVLVVNTNLVPPTERPRSILDLADPKWKGRCAIAKPLFGTTATHAACLFAKWGDERAQQFFRTVKDNVAVKSGNKQVALSVAAGELCFGLTDTDDAVGELDRGMPVEIIYPDQGDGELGTLFIPNTIATIKNSPNPSAARQLIDYVLSPARGVEEQLAKGPSAQIPLGRQVTVKPRVETPHTKRAMEVDFEAAADHWESAAKFLREEFAR